MTGTYKARQTPASGSPGTTPKATAAGLINRPRWLIAGLAPPDANPGWAVARTDACAQLDEVLDRRVALVSAPAGYGKTTLLAQWTDTLKGRNITATWMSLDEDDADPVHFIAYLSAALDAAGVPLGRMASETGSGLAGASARDVALSILGDIAAYSHPVVLIIDDADRVHSADLGTLFDLLLANLPANAHLVFAGRALTGLKVSAFRARGELLSLSAQDLRFSEDDARGLLGNQMSEEELSELLEHTEGWPIALQMARLWMSEDAERTSIVRQYSGRSADIAQYLMEQIFEGLPTALQDFLKKTSVLRRFNGDVANAICGITDGWALIDDLVARNLLVIPLDRENRWFRFHQFFREFLSDRQGRDAPGQADALNLLAADWFLRHGDLSEAVHHHLAAQNFETAARIVDDAGGWKLLVSFHTAMLRRALRILPEEIINAHPRVALAETFALGKFGNPREGRIRMTRLKENLTPAMRANQSLMLEISLVDMVLCGYEDTLIEPGRFTGMETFTDPEPPAERFFLGLLNNTLCLFNLDRLRFAKACRHGDLAISHFVAAEFLAAIDFMGFHQGQAHLAMGEPEEAARQYDIALDRNPVTSEQINDLTAIARVLKAEVYYTFGDLAAADRMLTDALAHVEAFDGWFDIFAAAYRTRVMVDWALEGAAPAHKSLDRMSDQADKRNLRRLHLLRTAIDLHMADLTGDKDTAQDRAAALAPLFGTGGGDGDGKDPDPYLISWRLFDVVSLAMARHHLMLGDPETALTYLTPLIEFARAENWHMALQPALLLHAIAQKMQGRAEDAWATLETALLMLERSRMYRSVLEEGEPARTMVNDWLSAPRIARSAPAVVIAKSLLGMAWLKPATVDTAKAASHGEGTGEITDKERAVLIRIGDGLSTKEIAHALGVSENTVKFHRKNIYRKLRLTSRSEAVAAARNIL